MAQPLTAPNDPPVLVPRSDRVRLALASLARWFDSGTERNAQVDADRIDWLRTAPFIAVHLACVAVFWVGVSRLALEIAGALYVLRMFAITGFYHRYFAHRACNAGRCGGPPIIVPITSMPTRQRIPIRPRCMGSGGATWGGS